MTPRQRLDAVLAGQRPDRPPVSFWYHFPPAQVAGTAAVQAHLDLLDGYGLDFLKVMNDNPYPHAGNIHRVEDLASLGPLRGDEEGFGRQLELLAALQAKLHQRVYLASTIFNAWSVLRLLVETPAVHMPPNLDAAADAPSRWIRDAYAQRPDLVTAALHTIGENLGRFAARCLQAGADGIYLSVRDDWVDLPGAPSVRLYDSLVRLTDRRILQPVQAARFNILHVCGTARNFPAFAALPVAVLHWADRAAGPAIRDVKDQVKPVLAGGVNNLGTLVTGTPDQVRQEVRDAIAQAGAHPFIVAPGCTFDPARVPAENLRALVAAAQES
ncbi:MAG: uroporphyrinogen decarboxylase family protein [Phycisphaerae bacterium]